MTAITEHLTNLGTLVNDVFTMSTSTPILGIPVAGMLLCVAIGVVKKVTRAFR